jgi:hypothetical protein
LIIVKSCSSIELSRNLRLALRRQTFVLAPMSQARRMQI